MRTGYIYKVTNTVNGKIYIGQTIRSVRKRWADHTCNSMSGNYHFQNAIKKHGKSSFDIITIETVFENDEISLKCKLDELEKYYIKLFDTFKNGYNQTFGGGGTIGRAMSEANRKIISEYATGRILSEEHKHNISVSLRNRDPNKERKKRDISSYAKPWLGKNMSDEIREKMSKSAKGKSKTGWALESLLMGNAKRRKKISSYDSSGNFVKMYESITEACKDLHLQSATISKYLKGDLKRAGGLQWKLENKNDIDM